MWYTNGLKCLELCGPDSHMFVSEGADVDLVYGSEKDLF